MTELFSSIRKLLTSSFVWLNKPPTPRKNWFPHNITHSKIKIFWPFPTDFFPKFLILPFWRGLHGMCQHKLKDNSKRKIFQVASCRKGLIIWLMSATKCDFWQNALVEISKPSLKSQKINDNLHKILFP